jgi:transcription elongation GreA/GreB family factor
MSIARAFSNVTVDALEQEEFICLLIHEAHKCYAKSRQEAPKLEYYQVVDFVEGAICSKNQSELDAITKVVNDYNDSQFTKDLVKAGQSAMEEEKKSISSPITNALLMVN